MLFNRKIGFNQKIRVKLNGFGKKQWAYFTNSTVEELDFSKTDGYLEIMLHLFLSVFGHDNTTMFLDDKEEYIYTEESISERRKRLIEKIISKDDIIIDENLVDNIFIELKNEMKKLSIENSNDATFEAKIRKLLK